MYLMENSDFGKKLLCVNIELQQDGDLVCRIARFKYRRTSWNPGSVALFGVPS